MPALLIECQRVAVLSVRREPAPFEALSSVNHQGTSRLARYGFLYLAGDDDVELAAEEDSAFRRATRWCGT